MHQSIRLACITAAAATLLSVSAHAAIISGVTASASSELGTYNRMASYTVDGSGFDAATGTTTTSPDGTMWLTTGNGTAGGTADNSPYIFFDLGSLYSLSNALVWNYNEAYGSDTAGLNRGIASMTVYYATSLAADLASSFTAVGTFDLKQGSGDTTTNYSTNISLQGVTARYIGFTNFTHFANSDNNFFGLSEVRFDGVQSSTAVPEPASLALLGAGLLGAGLVRRSRKA